MRLLQLLKLFKTKSRGRFIASNVLRLGCLALVVSASPALAQPSEIPHYGSVRVGNERLHFMEAGHGATVIFIHGSLSDYTYWDEQILSPFAKKYHVLAYSRRYNFPNNNPPEPGYSAITDAEDLAGLIRKLHVGPVYLVGHSYGALTALFLTIRHPELVRAAVLAEPPAVSLLDHLDGPAAAQGRAMGEDIRDRMVAPMRSAFSAGRAEDGVAIFINYVFRDPNAWGRFSEADKAETMRDAHEWEVMLPGGTFFPQLLPDQVRHIRVPILLMSGAKSYSFLGLTDAALEKLISHAQRVIFPDSGHQMWLQHPDECRRDAEAFFEKH